MNKYIDRVRHRSLVVGISPGDQDLHGSILGYVLACISSPHSGVERVTEFRQNARVMDVLLGCSLRS